MDFALSCTNSASRRHPCYMKKPSLFCSVSGSVSWVGDALILWRPAKLTSLPLQVPLSCAVIISSATLPGEASRLLLFVLVVSVSSVILDPNCIPLKTRNCCLSSFLSFVLPPLLLPLLLFLLLELSLPDLPRHRYITAAAPFVRRRTPYPFNSSQPAPLPDH